MKTSSTSILGEKSRGLLRDLAFLSEDFILLAQACEFLADILLRVTSSEVAARSVSPASRFFPASRKSFDQR